MMPSCPRLQMHWLMMVTDNRPFGPSNEKAIIA